jgi:hypothetical protein
MYATMSESNIMEYVNNLFTFFKLAYVLISLLYWFCFFWFFTWIALGDADLCFSFILNAGPSDRAV